MGRTTWLVRAIVLAAAAAAAAIGVGGVGVGALQAVTDLAPVPWLEAPAVVVSLDAAAIILGLVAAVGSVATARRFRGGFLERPMYLVATGVALLVLHRVWHVAAGEAPQVPAPPHVVVQVIVLAAVVVWAIGFVELDQSV